MKCKHEGAYDGRLWVQTKPGSLTSGTEMIIRRCPQCGAYLPLGQSNDEPEQVRVEIRATQLANGARRTYEEETGWLLHSAHMFGASDAMASPPNTSGEWAGWLAHEIVTKEHS